ncbi:hypothetical protein EP837_02809 [Sphingobium sp. EP60837]|nr:hypothetical protein EP837_02809 [Sphingobium sp. EP60837]
MGVCPLASLPGFARARAFASASIAAAPDVAEMDGFVPGGDICPADPATAGAQHPPSSRATAILGLDGVEIGIDALLHVGLDEIGRSGFDLAIIFEEVHLTEVERLELLGREPTAVG